MFTVPKQVRKCTYSILIYIYIYISNKMYRYTVYFIWKLLYMFRVVPPPIIRSVNNCIYSILYLSDRYCYPPLQGVNKTVNYIFTCFVHFFCAICAIFDAGVFHKNAFSDLRGFVKTCTMNAILYLRTYIKFSPYFPCLLPDLGQIRYAVSAYSTGMRHLTTFRSTTACMYDGGPIIL